MDSAQDITIKILGTLLSVLGVVSQDQSHIHLYKAELEKGLKIQLISLTSYFLQLLLLSLQNKL